MNTDNAAIMQIIIRSISRQKTVMNTMMMMNSNNNAIMHIIIRYIRRQITMLNMLPSCTFLLD